MPGTEIVNDSTGGEYIESYMTCYARLSELHHHGREDNTTKQEGNEPSTIRRLWEAQAEDHSIVPFQETALVHYGSVSLVPADITHGPPELVKARGSPVPSTSTFRMEDLMFSRGPNNDPSCVYGQGRFQTIILICCQLAGFVYMSHYTSILLLAPDVDHWCAPPPSHANMSDHEWKIVGVPIDSSARYRRCVRYEPPLDVQAPNRSESKCRSWKYDLNTYGHTIVDEWDLVCDRAWLISMLSTLYMVGSTVAIPIASHMSEMVGRKPIIYMSIVVLLLCGFAECFATFFLLFAALHFMVGMAASVVQVTSFILLFEVCTKPYRAYYNSIAIIGMGGAFTFIEFFRLYGPSRIISQVTLMIPTAFLISNFYLLVESPVWLMSTWRIRQAEQIVLWISEFNGVYDYEAKKRWSDIKKGLAHHEEKMTYIAKTGLLDLILSRRLRFSMITLFLCWVSTVFTIYGFVLSLGFHHPTARIISVLLQFPVSYAVYKLLPIRGLNATLSFSLALCSAASCFLMIFRSDPTFTIMYNVARCAVSAATVTLMMCSVEVLPVMVSGLGARAAFAFGRLGATAAPFLRELAAYTDNTAPYAMISVLMAVCSVLAVHLPETKATKPSESGQEIDKGARRKMLLDLPPCETTSRQTPSGS
ncbi:organic cation/carnitine transporter 2-like [Ornithodoros turicata]|uniref:organic cation/carnitine transporter 2-like n=1 Tax=Ornithodoros turicata TaxID=34597 RepID=UPI00313A1C6F